MSSRKCDMVYTIYMITLSVSYVIDGSLCCIMTHTLWIFLFFQAEDGIRDLVRSRGLGDVYKRQVANRKLTAGDFDAWKSEFTLSDQDHAEFGRWVKAVSYTHLTLPTSDLV